MEISNQDLDGIVMDTLALFVGGDAAVDVAFVSPGPWCASVALRGELAGRPCSGLVEVVADDDSAACIAGSMLGMSAELCGDDDVIDVLGEVANTVGGNVKACLGDGLVLGLPDCGRRAAAGGVEVTSRGYRCGELGITVRVVAEGVEVAP